jgi:hypothetical protein
MWQNPGWIRVSPRPCATFQSGKFSMLMGINFWMVIDDCIRYDDNTPVKVSVAEDMKLPRLSVDDEQKAQLLTSVLSI